MGSLGIILFGQKVRWESIHAKVHTHTRTLARSHTHTNRIVANSRTRYLRKITKGNECVHAERNV